MSLFYLFKLPTLFQQLNLPSYPFKIKTQGERKQIFDVIRKKYVVLTPEEWVRQHVIRYLISEKAFPPSLIAVEAGLKYNKMQKRSDIVVYDKNGGAAMMVECKAPSVKITQDVFDQVARYNMTLKVRYLVVTNGINHFCCLMDYEAMSYSYLEEIPLYDQLVLR